MHRLKSIIIHQKKFLEKAKERKQPIYLEIERTVITVNPGVFTPATDTRLLAANIKIRRGEKILDLTTGCGAIALIAGLQGAKGKAIDINPESVKNATENFTHYKVKIKALRSDLFEKVPNEKFDQIFANGPFLEGPIIDDLDRACYGAKDFIARLFKELGKHLRSRGSLLIVLPTWSDLEFFRKNITRNQLKSKLVSQRQSDDGKRIYNLYKITAS